MYTSPRDDGSWNAVEPNEFYCATTASVTNKTRLWRCRNDMLDMWLVNRELAMRMWEEERTSYSPPRLR